MLFTFHIIIFFSRVWQLFDGESSCSRDTAYHSCTGWPATCSCTQHAADEKGWRGESIVCIVREHVRVVVLRCERDFFFFAHETLNLLCVHVYECWVQMRRSALLNDKGFVRGYFEDQLSCFCSLILIIFFFLLYFLKVSHHDLEICTYISWAQLWNVVKYSFKSYFCHCVFVLSLGLIILIFVLLSPQKKTKKTTHTQRNTHQKTCCGWKTHTTYP